MIAAAAALSVYNHETAVQSKKRADHITEQIKTQIETRTEDEPTLDLPVPYPQQEEVSLTVSDSEWIGILAIPSIGAELPVSRECSYELMKSGLCRYSGSVNGEDMIVCGHNYRGYLDKLSQVREGDEVVFTDCRGVVHKYAVTQVSLIGGRQRSKLFENPDDWQLTVFTCNYSGYSRYVVRCELI